MKTLNLVLREKYDPKKLSAVPRLAFEIARRAQKEFKVNIISNGEKEQTVKFNTKINLVYLPGSLLSFFTNTLDFTNDADNRGPVHFLGSLSGGCVFSWIARNYPGKIILGLINGGVSVSDFKYLRWYDYWQQPFNCVFHPSVLGVPLEWLFAKQLVNKNIAGIIVQSHRLAGKILARAPHAKAVRIPYGVAKPRQWPKKTLRRQKEILYFGHAYTVRGLDDMLEALNLLDKTGDDWHLKLIVTPETNLKFLQSTLNRFPSLKARTTIIARYLDDLDQEVCQADLCLFLYRFAGEIPEYPLALLEAMALGVLVITTDVGAIGELFQNSLSRDCLARPGDIEVIRDKIQRFLTPSKDLDKIVEINRATTSSMTWDKCYATMKRFY